MTKRQTDKKWIAAYAEVLEEKHCQQWPNLSFQVWNPEGRLAAARWLEELRRAAEQKKKESNNV